MRISKKEILCIAKEQLAIDLNCRLDDFNKEENTIVIYKQLERMRKFSSEDYFIKIATFGSGAVVSCDEKIQGWCEEYFSTHKGIDCFEHPIMREIDNELSQYNKKLNVVHELYLPYTDYNMDINLDFEIKLFEHDEIIRELYNDTRFTNALIYDKNSPRQDVLAIAAYDKGEIIGLAGASADCEMLWQIGIDVLPTHRKNGVAKKLVYLLTKEILKRGVIPYYGTWSSNIASRNIAQGCGYYPAWVEMYSVNK